MIPLSYTLSRWPKVTARREEGAWKVVEGGVRYVNDAKTANHWVFSSITHYVPTFININMI